MGNFTINRFVGALVCALFILPLFTLNAQVNINTPGLTYFCGDSTFEAYGSIVIEETDSSAIDDGTVYTYRVGLPSGFQFEPGVGSLTLFPSNQFFNGSTITVADTFVEISYEAKASSATAFNTITIGGLRILAETPGIMPDTLFRVASSGTEAIITGDSISDRLPHGILASVDSIVFSASTVVQPLCNGENNGSITINATGGGGGFFYSVDNGSNFSSGNSFTNLGAGTYDLLVLDDSGCSELGPQEILVDPAPIVLDSSKNINISCNALADGQIAVYATGGTGSLYFSINSFADSTIVGDTIKNLTAGSYLPVIHDTNGCQLIVGALSITEPAAISFSQTNSDPSCNGFTDGNITFSASGGTPPLQYSIDNGGSFFSTNAFTSLGGGSYDLVVRDTNGCVTSSTNVVLTNPAAINYLGETLVDPSCNGENSGSITINGSGGSAPLSYSIDNGSNFQSSNAFPNLLAGSYDLVIQDANGCSTTPNNEVLTDPAALVIDSITKSDISCFGLTDGQLTLYAQGGTGALIYSYDGFATNNPEGTSFTGLSAGSYTPVLRDANLCQLVGTSQSIVEPSAVSITNESINDVSCNGAADGSITITATGGTAPLGFSITGGAPYQAGNSFTSLGGTGYTISVEDANGCTATGSTGTITEPTALVLSAPTETDPTCNGGSDGTVVVNASGGTPPYQYSIDNGSNYSSSATFSGLTAGTYNLAVQDDNGCITTGTTATLTDPAAINISGVSVTNVQCNAANDGLIVITASGGTGGLSYSITGAAPFQGSNNFPGLSPGSYTPAVSDANGCIAVNSSVSITEPSALQIINENLTDVSCNGLSDGSISITATGGTAPITYSITGGAPYQASNTFSGLAAGAFSISIRDNNSCVLAGTAGSISEPPVLVPGGSNVTNVSTAGGSDGVIQIVGTSGGTAPYLYSLDGGINTQSSNTFGGLTSGTYTVTVIDANGCTDLITPINVSEPGSGLQAGGIDINGGVSEDVCVGGTTPVINLNSAVDATGGNTDSTLNYQWQSSPDGAVWTDIGGATTSSYVVPSPYTITTFYRREATRGANPGSPFEGPVYTNFVVLNVNALPTATVLLESNAQCIEGNNLTVSGFPTPTGGATGSFSILPVTSALVTLGPGVAQFRPDSLTGAGAFTITYSYADDIGCADTDNDVLTINENTSASFATLKTDYLITDSTEILSGSPSGGVFSGPGISGNSFTPFVAGIGGPYNLVYQHFDGNGCLDSAVSVVNVLDTGGSVIVGLNASYCEYDAIASISAALPTGATARAPFWRITGNTGLSNFTATTVDFDPTAVTLTNTNLTVSFLFSKGGNPDSIKQTIIVYTQPVVGITGPAGPYCQTNTDYLFTGTPTSADGTWFSGNIADQGDGTAIFNPTAVTAGSQTLSYEFLDIGTGCRDTASVVRLVNALPTVSIDNIDNNYCSNAPDTLLTASPVPGGPTTGVFVGSGLSDNGNGSANFVPSSLVPTTYVLSYIFTDVNGCSNQTDSTVQVVQKPILNFDIPSFFYCENDTAQNVINVAPVGGSFSGMGMSGPDSVFYPGQRDTTGINLITYDYTDPMTGCRDVLTKSVNIEAKPNALFSILDTAYCDDVGGTIFIQSNKHLQGLGHAWAVSPDPTSIINVNSGQVTLSKDLMSGTQTYTIDYIFTETNTCKDSITDTFILKALPVVTYSIIDQAGSILTGSPISFCQNEDSIVLVGNQSGGIFVDNGTQADITNVPSSDSAFFSPALTFTRPGDNTDRQINYIFTDTVTGCTNDTTVVTIVNELPNPLAMDGWGVLPTETAEFCTEDDSALITGILPPGFTKLSSYFSMDQGNNGTIGGIFPFGTDSMYFKPKLQSGFYYVRYAYTSIEGCTDSVEQEVFINAVPAISAEFDLQPVLDTDTVRVCINDPMRYRLQVKDSSSVNPTVPVADSTIIFSDLTEPSTIFQDINGEWYFVPLNGNINGLHTISYEYISGGGCRDAEVFLIDLLDTPSTSISNLSAQYCQTELDRLIVLAGNSTITPGFGRFFTGIGDNIVVHDNLDETANFFPDSASWAQGQTIGFWYEESVSGKNCRDTVWYPVDVFPLPNPAFLLSTTSICQDDPVATVQPLFDIGTPTTWTDSAFFYTSHTGPVPDTAGQTLGHATIDPNLYTSVYSDIGNVDTITFIRISTEGCIDSLKREIVIHPRPRIDLNVVDKNNGDTIINFCNNDPTAFSLQFGNTDNISTTLAPVYNGIGVVGADFRGDIPQPGIEPIYLTFTTLAGCTSMDSVYTNVYAEPTAAFTVDNFCSYDSISFSDLSTADDTTETIFGFVKLPDTVVGWEWRFDAPSNLPDDFRQNPKYFYDESGDYTAELIITTSIGCNNDTDTTYHIGEPPIADFYWQEICVTKNVPFRDSTLFDADASSWNWILDVGVADTVQHPTYTYTTPGPKSIRLIVGTLSGCFDTATQTLDVRPIINIGGANPIYTSDFDNDIIEWRPGSLKAGQPDAYSWVQAVPNGNVINSSPDTSTIVWITSDTSTHLDGEESFVMGPCFDFTASQRPMMKIQYWNETAGGRTGAVLQASTDKGNSWFRIGNLETGLEWYNSDPIIGNPGQQPFDRIGWSGNTGEFVDSRHQLDDLRQRDDVLLRIAFGADTAAAQLDGFAFGDIWIGERTKKVLMEHFTNSSDLNAKQGDIDNNDLIATHLYDAYDVQFHTDFPQDDPANLDNPSDNSTRSFIYSINSVPTSVFDGNKFIGPTTTFTSSVNTLANGRNKLIEDRILQDADFQVDVISNKTQTGVSGDVRITALDNLQSEKLRIQTAIIEAYVDPNNLNGGVVLPNSTFKSVMKKMLPDAIGTFVERAWAKGEEQTFSFNYTYTNVYDPDTVNVVAFVQSGNTREIYQVNSDDSTKVYDPLGVNDSWNLDKNFEFVLFPNPTSDMVYLRFEEILEDDVHVVVMDQLGKTVFERDLQANEFEAELNLDYLPSGIYFVIAGSEENRTIKRLVKR